MYGASRRKAWAALTAAILTLCMMSSMIYAAAPNDGEQPHRMTASRRSPSFSDKAKNEAVDPANTVFRLGSVFKLVNALGFLIVCEEESICNFAITGRSFN